MKMHVRLTTLTALLGAWLLASPLLAAPVDINKADAVTIASELKGVGPSKAKAIVDYRNKNGPFKTVDELRKVGGIGDKLLSKIRANVVIGGAGDGAKKATS